MTDWITKKIEGRVSNINIRVNNLFLLWVKEHSVFSILYVAVFAVIQGWWLWWMLNNYRGDNAEWVALPLVLFLILPTYLGAKIHNTIRNAYWIQFANEIGGVYTASFSLGAEYSLILKQAGNIRSGEHLIEAAVDGRKCRIFQFQFRKNTSFQRDRIYPYTVFAFEFSGNFPHLYLDRKKDQFRAKSFGQTVRLPTEFEKHFRLYAPKQYEIEALQIFDPSLLNGILETGLACDIELIGNKMYIFTNWELGELAKLREEFTRARKIVELFASVLNKFSYNTIGTYSPLL